MNVTGCLSNFVFVRGSLFRSFEKPNNRKQNLMNKIKVCVLILLLTLVLGNINANAETAIKILHSNDTHSRIMPIDSKNFGKDVSGAVRRANLIAMIRQNFPQTLVLDAGDMFQGTPFFNFFKGEANYRIAKASGYHATTLGNHELDLSLENLLEKLRASGMRLLCCNVFYRNNDKHVFKPFHIFAREGKKIAVIGSIGDDAWIDIDKKTKAPLYATPQLETVRETAEKLRPYVDLIVVLSHSGYELDKKMAAAISEVDVILGGHTHTELFHPELVINNASAGSYNNGLNGTIVAQTGEYGVFLGVVDLILDDAGKIATFSGRLEPITAKYDKVVNKEVHELVEYYHKQVESQMSRVAGSSETELSYPKNLKKTHLLPMGSFTAEAMRAAANADICLVNSGGIRAGIKSGKITCGQVFEALPYDNTVVTYLMSGAQLKKMLDFLCANSKDLDGFQYAGLSGTIDLVKARYENIKVNGEEIDENKIYRVCTSSFVANGNLGGDKLFARVEGVEDSGIFMRDAAIAYLEETGELPDFSQNPLKLVSQ